MKKAKLPPGLKGMAFTVFADFLLIGGGLLFALGLSRFLSKLWGVEGGGEMAVGAFLFILGIIILSRLRLKVVGMQMPPPGAPPQPKPPAEGPSSYR